VEDRRPGLSGQWGACPPPRLASPLANVDKITIVSTGDGNTAGAHKITGDITAMAAQVPALFEALSGMQLSELLAKVKMIGPDDEKVRPAA
jgi:flotillin